MTARQQERITVTAPKKIRLIEAPGQRIEVSRVFDGADLIAITRWWYYILLAFWAQQIFEDTVHIVRFLVGVA